VQLLGLILLPVFRANAASALCNLARNNSDNKVTIAAAGAILHWFVGGWPLLLMCRKLQQQHW
jgi:hypothetical protein